MIAPAVLCRCKRKVTLRWQRQFLVIQVLSLEKSADDQHQEKLIEILTQHLSGIKVTEIHLNLNPIYAIGLFLYPLKTQTTRVFLTFLEGL